jgi:hypothetical protein
MRLAIDPHEDFVQVPTPARIRLSLNKAFSDLRGKHRTEPAGSRVLENRGKINRRFMAQGLSVVKAGGKRGESGGDTHY